MVNSVGHSSRHMPVVGPIATGPLIGPFKIPLRVVTGGQVNNAVCALTANFFRFSIGILNRDVRA